MLWAPVNIPQMCVAQIMPTVALKIMSIADPIRFRTACIVVGLILQYVVFLEMDVVPHALACREGVLSPVRVHKENSAVRFRLYYLGHRRG